ncbi:EAL domain, c-di-GMP-specific phosphodiesterase class I (or its enzymatically inactive variant) [Belnapia rosea]|uniref:EAL domain, c-di-GMP-specific phosphodiesterase class I (Or its enzymatically inactive variant) n=2 Tax=Belnapia rosea TaxID=938405 RepID=A0A1G6M3I4_9PROT|nr:EAL domain, c-di-GMP-specific phosphodiesterase class I (or its enzymatically inactive variant) [Belnapia rosea]SDC50011.1 EAL domain, c-di-GMP-specific phosphodiesterase class I (or its enzymatically inactive variant) [Belnapia rosea]
MIMMRPAGPANRRLVHNLQGMPASTLHGDAAALAAGLTNGEVSVHYQPVVRLRDRKPVMVEALARWHRPPSLVSPSSFVPLAESSGLVRALSMVVATQAATELGPLWQQLRLTISVNLPLGQLLLPDLPAWLHRALRVGGLHPGQVALELTETTEVRDRSALRRALMRLRRAGHRVLLDDIVLHDERDWLLGLPFGAFKLDRSLVEQLPRSAHARREVRRMVRMAERGGRQVIAEGVSDQRLWQMVRSLGVHHAQGYLVSRPLPAAALAAWHGQWRGGPA